MTKLAEIYACLYVPEFPAQALQRLRPELRGCPCVVMQGEPPLQVVCSLNNKARMLGLQPGMTQVEVDALSEITALRRSLNEETTAKAILLECAGGYSPRVEDRSEDRVFQCVIDIAGTEKLFGAPETLARSLHARSAALGIAGSVAVCSNVGAAVALAKGISPQTVKAITAGSEAAALEPLPLSVLDIGENHAETLALWGIRTLGMLAALPERELISRMGQEGKRLRQLARGEMPHLFQPVEPPFTLAERMEFDSPIELLDALMFVVNLMLEQVTLRAAARMLALASVTITLSLEGGAEHMRTVRPALPSNDRQLWIKLLHLDLEAHPPPAAILAARLDAEPGSTSKVQLGLFSPQLPESSRLDVTLARIRAIVGEENAGRAVLEDTHRPDGFRMEPFRLPTTKPLETGSAPLRPAMRILRPPEATFVMMQSGRPKAFVFREQQYAVDHAYGPWQTSGDWWSQTLWGCEQWDLMARTTTGAMICCCLVRDLLRDQWRMAALYD